MSTTKKFIISIVVIIVLAVAGILIYQGNFVPNENEEWVEEEQEKNQRQSIDSAANNSAIFD